MTTTSPTPAPSTADRDDVPTSVGARRRGVRWPVFATCVVVAIAGGLASASLISRAGDRVQVLAVARDVPAGHTLQASDLTTASIPKDPALSPVTASDRDSVLGQRAVVDLRGGSLLTRSELSAGGGVGDTKQLVGVELKRGQVPRDALVPADKVLAVTVPAEGSTSTDDEEKASDSSIPATVVAVGPADASGAVTVNLAVATTDGPSLAVRAASKQVALVREPRS